MRIRKNQAEGTYVFSSVNHGEELVIRELIKASRPGAEMQYDGCRGKSDEGGSVESMHFSIGSTSIDQINASKSGLISRKSVNAGGLHVEVAAGDREDKRVLNELRLDLYEMGKVLRFQSGEYREKGSHFVLLTKSR